MATIVGIAESLRAGSFNAALLASAARLMPTGAKLEIDTIRGIPLYDADIETKEGAPESVATLKRQITAADGLLISTPEYNHSIPGVLKNAIDWPSRPQADIPRIFGGRPVAIMGASMSKLGTIQAQSAWLPALKSLQAQLWCGQRLLVPRAHTAFDVAGRLVDAQVQEELRVFIEGFVDYVVRQ